MNIEKLIEKKILLTSWIKDIDEILRLQQENAALKQKLAEKEKNDEKNI